MCLSKSRRNHGTHVTVFPTRTSLLFLCSMMYENNARNYGNNMVWWHEDDKEWPVSFHSKIYQASCCCLPTPMTHASGGVRCSRLWSTSQCSHSDRVCPQIQGWQCGCSWRDDVCRVCESYRGGIVVKDMMWCVNTIWGRVIYLFWVGYGCDEWGGEVSLQSC